MLTTLFTLWFKLRREVLIAREAARFHAAGGFIPDGLCDVGHAFDDHLGDGVFDGSAACEEEDVEVVYYLVVDEDGTHRQVTADEFFADHDDEDEDEDEDE